MRNEEQSYNLWRNVDACRNIKNYTLADLSRNTGIKVDKIKSWRTRMAIPQADELYSIATALNTTVEFLLTGKEERIISIADEVYEYMQTEMPSLLEDIMRKISLKKEAGFSGNRA